MSAESPRRSRMGGPLVIAPQPPSDRSLMDTVSGFINDVTLTNGPPIDPKDSIQWARFEVADINEPAPEGEGCSEVSPLLLIVGYGSGVQVWLIPPNGDAQEVLSWRQGSVKLLRVLPSPSCHDNYSVKRPLISLCDSAGPGPSFCSLSFISLRGGDQVKSIKFKNPVLDVLANKRSVVVSFSERLAVFDACTLEDRVTVTTCYPSPCPLGSSTPTNPIALGDRWLAYSERKLIANKRSSGGCEGEGVSTYTATVLHAAKSLGKGLRGLGESVASSLAGSKGGTSQSPSPPHSEQQQPGVVTVLDIESSPDDDIQDVYEEVYDPMVAHFVAHSDAIVALKFDSSGMLLITADRRGHDFHVFRIHPHLNGPSLASVHHLYILHRGDTTAKVQDITLSVDSRWAAVSTLRGTVHVYALTPYGGPCGVRTHSQSRVVNRLSRFHRSAGLTPDGRSHSPVGETLSNASWYPNPRLPPYPTPTLVSPLAQLRPTPNGPANVPTHTITRNSSGRQRLSSLSEEGCAPLCVRAMWGPAVNCGQRAPRVSSATLSSVQLTQSPGAHSLYIMSAHGLLLHYIITPRPLSGIPKEKICDDTPIELDVEVKSQWSLNRPPNSPDVMLPLPHGNPLLVTSITKDYFGSSSLEDEDKWLSQVEIVTHAGPHRRLWMGPQFVFKTYNMTAGSSLSLLDVEAVEVGTGPALVRSNPVNIHHSSPVNIQHTNAAQRPIVPVLIESGSASSLEHSPRMSDAYRKTVTSESVNNYGSNSSEGQPPPQHGDVRLREDLAEAMKETDQGCELMGGAKGDPLRGHHVRRVVNPLGTVVSGNSSESGSPPSEDPDIFTRANEDESLFRPVVRAPKSMPPPCEMETQSLSTCTVIPAKRIQPRPIRVGQNCGSTTPLKSGVIIPAALSDTLLETGSKKVDVTEINVDTQGVADTKHEKYANKITSACNQVIESRVSVNKCVLNKNSNANKKKSSIKCNESKACIQELCKAIENTEIEVFNVKHNRSSVDINHLQPKIGIISKETSDASVVIESVETDNNVTDNISVNAEKRVNVQDVDISVKESFDLKNEINVSETCTITLPVPTKRRTKKFEIINKPVNEFETVKTEEQAWELLSSEKNERECNVETSKATVEINKAKLTRKSRKSKVKEQSDIKTDSKLRDKADEFDIINVKETCMEENAASPVTSSLPFKSWSAIVEGPIKANQMNSSPKLSHPTDSQSDSSFNKLASFYNLNNVVMAMCDVPNKELNFFDKHPNLSEEPPPLEPLEFTFENNLSSDALFDLEHEFVENVDTMDENNSLSNSKAKRENNTASTYCDILKFKKLEKIDRYSNERSESSSPVLPPDEPPKVVVTCSEVDKEKVSEGISVMDKSSDEENMSPSSSQTESDDCFPRLSHAASEELVSEVSETQISTSVSSSLQKANKKRSKRKRR